MSDIDPTTEEAIVETTPAPEAELQNAPAESAEPAAEPEVAAPIADPTLDEAEAMFTENPGLAYVRTDAGVLSRDGILTPAMTGA